MPSSYTSSLRLVLPVTGELQGTWGDTVNSGLTNLVDSAIAGTAAIAMTDANYTLSVNNEAADEARCMFLNLTGTLTTTRDVICPNVSKLYFVHNGTNQPVLVRGVTGTGTTVPVGSRLVLYSNGTNVVPAINDLPAAARAGGIEIVTISGAQTLTNKTISVDNNTVSGIAASSFVLSNGSGNIDGAAAQKAIPAGTVVGTSDAQTLTNKTISGSDNTLSNIANASLTNSSITFGATAQALGSTVSALNAVTIGSSTAAAGTFTTLTATADSAFTSTGALTISKGNTSQRPTPTSGMLRFNTQTSEFEGYNGTAWASVGGAGIVNDTSTTSNLFPLFANATTGTATTLFTGNAKLLYKPSTGELQSTALVASNGLVVNSATVTENYSIPSGSNAMSAGPVTVNSGAAVTVPSGSRWVVI